MVAQSAITPLGFPRSAKLAAEVVLLIESDRNISNIIVSVLQRNGYDVLKSSDSFEAMSQIEYCSPGLIVVDASVFDGPAAEDWQVFRAHAKRDNVPLIYLVGLERAGEGGPYSAGGMENFIVTPVRPPELVARVAAVFAQAPVKSNAQIERRSVERGHFGGESAAPTVNSGASKRVVLNEHGFDAESKFDVDRAQRARLPISLAYIKLFELGGIRETFGQRGQAAIVADLTVLLEQYRSVARFGVDANGHLLLLLTAAGVDGRNLLNTIGRAIVAHRFHLGADPIRLTPIIGFAVRTHRCTVGELRRRAFFALASAESHLDLQAVGYTPRLERATAAAAAVPLVSRARLFVKPFVLPLQIASTVAVSLILPFCAYWLLGSHGAEITGVLYIVCVAMLCFTALGILCESLLAIREDEPPSAVVYPAASAIIAAYLPNEAATIIETIEAFLRVEYAGELQIILAYNTPRPLPMEEELAAIAARDPRFVPTRIYGSTSKAQNVNAALRSVRGAFVGVFDADHKPDPNSFTRAWDWLASGYDVVQGHCLIRNGDESLIAQLVAVEFESIYAVSHPGRARLHGFGLFGGSNGYWKTDLLRQTRMHGFMLTEDIDSSLRIVEAGYRIASDRNLISRELAPITLRALWHQRLRWAQGWFQVSLKHLVPALRSPHLSVRQKFGIVHLLFWRECYVWMCIQIVPILAYRMFICHDSIGWFVPIFLATTVLTGLSGPLQLLFTYRLAHADIRKRRGWFITNIVASFLFFSELKNVIARLAHLKEAMRERTWKVTPRSTTLPHS